MGTSKPSDVVADAHGTSVKPQARQLLSLLKSDFTAFLEEERAATRDLERLNMEWLGFWAELIRPTPEGLLAVRAWVKSTTRVIRVLRVTIGAVTVALPTMTRTLRSAMDMAGAYSVEELRHHTDNVS